MKRRKYQKKVKKRTLDGGCLSDEHARFLCPALLRAAPGSVRPMVAARAETVRRARSFHELHEAASFGLYAAGAAHCISNLSDYIKTVNSRQKEANVRGRRSFV